MSFTLSRIKWTGLDALRKELKSIEGNGEKALISAMGSEGLRIMKKSRDMAPNFTGQLEDSWFIAQKGTSVTIGYTSPQALWQHEGTKPSQKMPPSQMFTHWAQAVLGDARLDFVVAKAVGERGLKARKFLSIPILEAMPGMAKRLAADANRRMK